LSRGDWSIVVMRPDGSAGFDATVRAGAEVPALPWISAGTLGLGGVLLVGGILLMVVPAARASHARPHVSPQAAPEPTTVG
jgi:hypothetical protein